MKEVVHREHLDPDHWWFRARRDIFARLLDELVELPAHARILDLGPGSGVNLPVLAPRGEVCVLDLSRFSLEQCRADGASDLVEADATVHPFQARSFDLVTALDVFEHLADDTRAMAECRRVVKDDGWLLCSVPAFPLLWGRQDVLAMHERRYRKRELAERLRGAGFRVERMSYFNSLLFPPILAVRLAMRPFLSRTAANGGSDLGMRLPAFVEGSFYRMFAAEGGWLVKRDLPVGVSLVALARPA